VSPSEYQDLAEFLGRQFAAIDTRFTGIDAKFTGIDRQFVGLHGRLAAMDLRFDRMETELREFRAEVLGHFDEIYRRLELLQQEYYAVLEALRRIEAAMADDRARREIIEHDLAELKRRVATLEARVETLEGRMGG
jgi:chromosome segregation ATPase